MYASDDPYDDVDKDLKRSFEFHTKACALGLAAGCFSVGFMYEQGEHVRRNLSAARKWYEKACSAGSGGACNNLGLLNQHGSPNQQKTALDLFRRACALKDTGACATAGTAFAEAGDHDKAMGHWDKACEYGDAGWCAALGVSYADGTPLGSADGSGSQRVAVQVDLAMARKYFSKACARGIRVACNVRQQL